VTLLLACYKVFFVELVYVVLTHRLFVARKRTELGKKTSNWYLFYYHFLLLHIIFISVVFSCIIRFTSIAYILLRTNMNECLEPCIFWVSKVNQMHCSISIQAASQVDASSWSTMTDHFYHLLRSCFIVQFRILCNRVHHLNRRRTYLAKQYNTTFFHRKQTTYKIVKDRRRIGHKHTVLCTLIN